MILGEVRKFLDDDDQRPCSVQEFLQRLTGSERSTYPSNGEGVDLRFEGDKVSGSALVCQDEIIHLSAYNLAVAS